MELDPKIWGPHYWFVLQTISLSYPLRPNNVTKKKYYDFIQNFPLFIPIPELGDKFSIILDKFPVTPYLDSRESFMKWVHFIHNQINKYFGKDEMLMGDALNIYYKQYKPKQISKKEQNKIKEKYIYGGLLMLLLGGIIFLHQK